MKNYVEILKFLLLKKVGCFLFIVLFLSSVPNDHSFLSLFQLTQSLSPTSPPKFLLAFFVGFPAGLARATEDPSPPPTRAVNSGSSGHST